MGCVWAIACAARARLAGTRLRLSRRPPGPFGPARRLCSTCSPRTASSGPRPSPSSCPVPLPSGAHCPLALRLGNERETARGGGAIGLRSSGGHGWWAGAAGSVRARTTSEARFQLDTVLTPPEERRRDVPVADAVPVLARVVRRVALGPAADMKLLRALVEVHERSARLQRRGELLVPARGRRRSSTRGRGRGDPDRAHARAWHVLPLLAGGRRGR